MIWANLKKNKCPNCGTDLTHNNNYHIHECICGFKIGEEKFNVIVNQRYSVARTKYDPEENLEALNNLGHELVASDFSDSPHLK